MRTDRVLFFSEPFPDAPVDRLAAFGEVVVGTRGVRGADFAPWAPRIEALMTVVADKVTETLLASLPRLRVVANIAVGYDNIDLSACARRGVIVTNTADAPAEATADLTLALLLDVARRVSESDRYLRAGRWVGWTPTLMLGSCVHRMTLGIVGLGRIGRGVARRARGFGMQVLYTQRTRLAEEEERALGVAYRSLDALLGESDAVSLHIPLTGETHGLMNAARFASMKKGAFFVNTTRGKTVDEEALVAALASGHLGGAGLDVFVDEPHVPAPLLAMENVVLCPHIGSADRATRGQMAARAIENVVRVLRGEPPLDPVFAPA